MMCRRVPYLPEHANLLKPRKQFSQMEVESIDRFVGIPYSYMETVMLEDEPVAVLGMVLLWKVVAEVWTVISEAAKKAPISFHKCVLASLIYHERLLGVSRTQMAVRKEFEEGRKWAESLGFDLEGIMVKYGPDGKDFYRYARIT